MIFEANSATFVARGTFEALGKRNAGVFLLRGGA